MKTIFDENVRAVLLERIRLLNPESKARWGKMTVFQMARHCTIWSAWVAGTGSYTTYRYKQDFLGRIFGNWALRSNTRDEKPIGRNMPSGKAFLTRERDGDIEAEKTIWMQHIASYSTFSNNRFIHDFFGKMSVEQIGIFSYKHFDHHLRQFGV